MMPTASNKKSMLREKVRTRAKQRNRLRGIARALTLERLEDRQLLAVLPGLNLSTGTSLTTYTPTL